MDLERNGTRGGDVLRANPAPPAGGRPEEQKLRWPAERAVRLAWMQAYLDALGYTGEVSEARCEQARQEQDPAAFAQVWLAPATAHESEDALVAARWAILVDDPQTLGAELDVNWRQVTEDAFHRWWDTSQDAWELLLAAAPRISRQALVRLAAACARTALRYVPKGEERPRIALETAEAWTRGEATLLQVQDAYTASSDAAASATATDDAAFVAASDAAAYAAASDAAAYAALSVASASDATGYAASSAYAAAHAAAYANAPDGTPQWERARQTALRELADLVRSMQSFPGW